MKRSRTVLRRHGTTIAPQRCAVVANQVNVDLAIRWLGCGYAIGARVGGELRIGWRCRAALRQCQDFLRDLRAVGFDASRCGDGEIIFSAEISPTGEGPREDKTNLLTLGNAWRALPFPF